MPGFSGNPPESFQFQPRNLKRPAGRQSSGRQRRPELRLR